MQMLKAGAVYFALVFGAGFVLGTIRTIWAVPRVPRVGTRTAELMEMPIATVSSKASIERNCVTTCTEQNKCAAVSPYRRAFLVLCVTQLPFAFLILSRGRSEPDI